MNQLRGKFGKVIGVGFHFEFTDVLIPSIKYYEGTKFLTVGGQNVLGPENMRLDMLQIPEELHWCNPYGVLLSFEEKKSLYERLHELYGFLNKRVEIRVYKNAHDSHLDWLFGQAKINFFRLFRREQIDPQGSKCKIEGSIFMICKPNKTIAVPFRRLPVDSYFFFWKKEIPVFLFESMNGEDLEVAEKMRKWLASLDCGYYFEFHDVESNPETHKIVGPLPAAMSDEYTLE